MFFQTAIRDFSHGSFQMILFLSQHKPFLSYICIVPWKVWLKGYGSYNYNIYWTRSLFIFFSPVWKYCIVTQERINMSFCTERDVIGHLGAHWEEKPKEKKKIKKGKYIWDFCLQWFEFYRNGFGWWAQGERRSGSGRFLENKGWLTFTTKKTQQARREFLFVCPGENLRSLFFPFISRFPPPTASSLHPLCFLFSSHYLTKLLFPPEHPPDPWQRGICSSTGTNTPFLIPPTNLTSPVVSRRHRSSSLCQLILVYVLDAHSLITFFTCCLFCPRLWLHFSQQRFVSTPISSSALCSAPSLCPRPDIKGSMKEYVPSITYTPARTHPDTHTHTRGHKPTSLDQVLTNKCTHGP